VPVVASTTAHHPTVRVPLPVPPAKLPPGPGKTKRKPGKDNKPKPGKKP
jgi:hypothetical protein